MLLQQPRSFPVFWWKKTPRCIPEGTPLPSICLQKTASSDVIKGLVITSQSKSPLEHRGPRSNCYTTTIPMLLGFRKQSDTHTGTLNKVNQVCLITGICGIKLLLGLLVHLYQVNDLTSNVESLLKWTVLFQIAIFKTKNSICPDNVAFPKINEVWSPVLTINNNVMASFLPN